MTTHFDSSEYWEKRYEQGGNSGAGSYHHLATFKADVLNNFFKRYKIQKVVEYGCGDGNQLSLLEIPNYIGYDVSKTIIERNRERFKEDKTKSFEVINEDTKQFESADVVLSLDVIFHLIEEDIFENYMKRIFSHPYAKFVVIYSTNQEKIRAVHVKDRKITPYIVNNFSEWEMFMSVPNLYGHIPHPHGSNCSFFFYRRREV